MKRIALFLAFALVFLVTAGCGGGGGGNPESTSSVINSWVGTWSGTAVVIWTTNGQTNHQSYPFTMTLSSTGSGLTGTATFQGYAPQSAWGNPVANGVIQLNIVSPADEDFQANVVVASQTLANPSFTMTGVQSSGPQYYLGFEGLTKD